MQFPWRINLLGGLSAQRGESSAVHFETRQTASLLAYLAFYPNRTHSREVLAEQVWPEEDGDATRSRLRTALWALRRTLETGEAQSGSVLISDRTGVGLVSDAFTTDVAEFEQALRAAQATTEPEQRATCLGRAIALYRAELLPGCYEEWIVPERERLAEAYRCALAQAAEAAAGCGDLPKAIEYARSAVRADPLEEAAHAALMAFYLRAGRAVDAVRQYQQLEQVLRVQMGMKPSAATRKLLQQMEDTTTEISNPVLEKRAANTAVHLFKLEPEGGAVPLDSPFYIERKTDFLFLEAVIRQDSIVLVKGARQMGKTSLLSRGLQKARAEGTRVVLTDLQKFTAAQMETSESLFLTLAREITDQLELDIRVEDFWHDSWGWNVNFERFLRRQVLNQDSAPLIWGLDEVDRLFGHPYSTEVFGLFRSWHNARSLDPGASWSRLTLAIAYATEAHLFITDLNQSPFNVGTRLTLDDFTPGEVAELNRRYYAPLQNEAEIARYIALVGGHPYLVRRGLNAMTTSGLDIESFETQADQDDGIFSDHLRRMRASLLQDTALYEAVCAVLRDRTASSTENFFRLQSAGVLVGSSAEHASLRCRLYERYLQRHLL